MDPAFHVGNPRAFAHARGRFDLLKTPTKICCSDRISKSPYRSTRPTRLQADAEVLEAVAALTEPVLARKVLDLGELPFVSGDERKSK